MIRTLAKISLVLLIIVVLPIGFFLVREFSALSKNEQIIERVFSTELESILYSINQYSENVVQQWTQSLDQPVAPPSKVMSALVQNLFERNPALLSIRFFKPEVAHEKTVYNRDTVFSIDTGIEAAKLAELRQNLQANYQRIEIAHWDKKLLLYFLPRTANGELVCQILIEPQLFIEQNLSPMIQQVAQDLFYVQIRDTVSGTMVFSTERREEQPQIEEGTAMWYLPEYKLGIRLKSKTIKELASERSLRDNLTLLGIGILVVLGFVFVLTNIRKQMKLAELKSEFVSNVSHEIRTPLALISMYAETLLMKRVKTEEKQQEYLQTIRQECIRLTDIVTRILNFSRIEKNRLKYRFQPIDLKQALPEIVHLFDAQLMSGRVNCTVESTIDEAWVNADWESLKIIIGNLLDNAIKYNESAVKQIILRIIKTAKQIRVEIEDNGIGIAAKNQKYVFDQFYRVTEGDLATKAKGSGLGLNLVKRIMKAHGGDVLVRSALGEGSTFTLKFPLKT